MRAFWILFLICFAVPVSAQETEIFVDAELGQLAGSLRIASDDAPVVLIIPGSGPINRDGQRLPAYGLGPYAKLADAMALRGVSTLRIDKRGSYASKGAIKTTDDLHIAGYADDGRIWVDHLRTSLTKDCVWLLGHSEGGLVASVLAAKSQDGICGMILVASAGRTIDLVLQDQLNLYTKSKQVLRKTDDALATLKAGQPVDQEDLPLGLRGLFNPVNQKFYIDWMRYDPAAVLSEYSGRVLILQGTTDFQMSEEDAQALAAVQPKAQLEILEGINHNMSKTDLIFPPSDIPLDTQVMDIIAEFILRVP